MTQYDGAFYDTIDKGSQHSAQNIIPTLDAILAPIEGRRLIDVGCGAGSWAPTWRQYGWHVTGVDGEYARERAETRVDEFVAADLSRPLAYSKIKGIWDVAVSLEVAEHLPPERAASFIDDLDICVGRKGTIVFSAAIPGQGGTGHLNEQWPRYWYELLIARGYKVSGALRLDLWGLAELGAVENWYAQNLLVATRDEAVWARLTLLAMESLHEPHPIVHPVLYRHVHPRHPA